MITHAFMTVIHFFIGTSMQIINTIKQMKKIFSSVHKYFFESRPFRADYYGVEENPDVEYCECNLYLPFIRILPKSCVAQWIIRIIETVECIFSSIIIKMKLLKSKYHTLWTIKLLLINFWLIIKEVAVSIIKSVHWFGLQQDSNDDNDFDMVTDGNKIFVDSAGGIENSNDPYISNGADTTNLRPFSLPTTSMHVGQRREGSQTQNKKPCSSMNLAILISFPQSQSLLSPLPPHSSIQTQEQPAPLVLLSLNWEQSPSI